MRHVYHIILMLVLALWTGCSERMNNYSATVPQPNERFASSMAYNKAHGYATLKVPDGNYRIYVCSDTHLDKTADNFKHFIRLYHDDADCPAAVNLGDLVEACESYDFFEQALKDTPAGEGKHDTLFVTPGNHDLYRNQWESFQKHWPTSTYYFVVEAQDSAKTRDLFICLDSAQGTLGTLQLRWLRDLLESSHAAYRHIFIFSHVNMYRRDNTYADISTLPLEETMELMDLFSRSHVTQYWSGHDHGRELFSIGGVTYIIVDTLKDPYPEPAYMILHVGEQVENTFHSIP